jgi:hypothetical protein
LIERAAIDGSILKQLKRLGFECTILKQRLVHRVRIDAANSPATGQEVLRKDARCQRLPNPAFSLQRHVDCAIAVSTILVIHSNVSLTFKGMGEAVF